MGGKNAVYIGKLYTKDQIIEMYAESQKKLGYLREELYELKNKIVNALINIESHKKERTEKYLQYENRDKILLSRDLFVDLYDYFYQKSSYPSTSKKDMEQEIRLWNELKKLREGNNQRETVISRSWGERIEYASKCQFYKDEFKCIKEDDFFKLDENGQRQCILKGQSSTPCYKPIISRTNMKLGCPYTEVCGSDCQFAGSSAFDNCDTYIELKRR